MYAFCDECMRQGIEPIVGMEAYECDDKSIKDKEHKGSYHLILIAKNETGLGNLMEIHNRAAVDGFYYRPRTDWADLKEFGEGLIGASACVGGRIPQLLLAGEEHEEEVCKAIEFYKSCFDEFYLEIQPGTFEEQVFVNDCLAILSKETDTPLLVTNDIHYLDREDYLVHDAHVKLDSKENLKDKKLAYPDTCYWFMDRAAVKAQFAYSEFVTPEVVDEGLENAVHIAETCKAELSSKMHMPAFPVPAGKTEDAILYGTCMEKLNQIIEDKPNPQAYVDRLMHELEVIKQKGFCGYFLIVQDYIRWARAHGVPVGPGRGSAAGSLVANLLGISQADPLKYGLMFERFLDPCRLAIPDVDCDFGCEKRDEMFRYMVERYGYSHCALVSTFQMRRAKGAVRDAARVLGYEPEVGDKIAKLIPEVVYGDNGDKTTDLDIASAVAVVPELRELQKQYADVISLAEKLEGLPSASGIHAAGLLVSPIPLTGMVPLIKSSKEGVLATSLNLDDAEKQLVKFDFLALATVDVISATEKDIGWAFDYQDEALLQDEAVWNLIGSRHTTGIFQIASKTYRDRMPRLAPKTLEELAACLALVRGPCISSKMDELYMQIREGKQEVEKIHPLYDEVMKETNGIMIFQEQIIRLAVAFGFSLPEGFALMKSAQKKKVAQLKEFRPKFLAQAASKGCDEETANRIYDMVVAAGEYSFNKAHAISYALITYVSAYLKVHHPLAFMKNLLTNTYSRGEKDNYATVLEDCKRLGIKFLPPDINRSEWAFTIEDDAIRIGMCAIKGFGEKAMQQVMEHRPFASLQDTLDRVEKRIFNKKVVNLAIFAGLFDEVEQMTRREIYEHYMELRGEEPEETLSFSKGFVIQTFQRLDLLEDAIFGGIFTADPANELESFGWSGLKRRQGFRASGYIRKWKVIKTKKGDQMAFVSMATGDGLLECTVFPATYRQMKMCLKKNLFCVIEGKKETEESCILSSIEEVQLEEGKVAC